MCQILHRYSTMTHQVRKQATFGLMGRAGYERFDEQVKGVLSTHSRII